MTSIGRSIESRGLKGEIRVDGDKSISHRSLMISAISLGQTTINGLLEGEDVMRTAEALRLAGVGIEKINSQYIVNGVGIGGLSEPANAIYLGNSGTSARILMGLFAPYDFPCFFTGDDSLSSRPMERVMKPLRTMGAGFVSRSSGRLPACLQGSSDLIPSVLEMEVPSAQVKSAILLAAAQLNGRTVVNETAPSRNHTELMLKAFGAKIEVSNLSIAIDGGHELKSVGTISVPSDPSSVAFFIATALIVPDSKINLKNICINPTRTGFIEVAKRMGGRITIENQEERSGEPVADITVEHSPNLQGIDIEPEIAPSMIDEYPILSVVASCSKGKTVMRGLQELVVKESNRLASVADGLKICGVQCTADSNAYTLEVEGCPNGQVPGSKTPIKTKLDHRIAMSFLVMGLVSKEGVLVDDTSPIKTSFPSFLSIMNDIGGKVSLIN